MRASYLEKTMTVMPTLAVCTAAAALLAISAAHPLLTDAPKTPEEIMTTPAFHCEHVAQWARTAPLSPVETTDVLARCEASPPPMAMNLGWGALLRLANR
jgi:hypothetical protein